MGEEHLHEHLEVFGKSFSTCQNNMKSEISDNLFVHFAFYNARAFRSVLFTFLLP